MKTHLVAKAIVATSLFTLSLAAHATANTFNTIYGNNFGSGSSYSTTFLGDIDATFTANVESGTGKFSTKAGQGGYQGIGVSPTSGAERTPGEIDIGESIHATFSEGIFITSFALGLLFDGPEYNDVNEVAQVKVGYLDGTFGTFTLTATDTKTAIWSGVGSFVSNLSPAKDGIGGAWSVANPFGNVRVTSLSFGASTGMSDALGCGDKKHFKVCTNQSDFTLISVSAIPEPQTYMMMMLGLLGVGYAARKRQA